MSQPPESDAKRTMPAVPIFISVDLAKEVMRVLGRMLRTWKPRDSESWSTHRDGEVLLQKLIKETKP